MTETKRLTDEELAAIEQRAERATPGPWGVERSLDEADVYEITESSVFLSPIVAETRFLADAEFIAHARKDIPRLIAEVRRLQELVNQYEALAFLSKKIQEGGE